MFQSRSSQCKNVKFFNAPIMEYKVISVDTPFTFAEDTRFLWIAHIQFFKRIYVSLIQKWIVSIGAMDKNRVLRRLYYRKVIKPTIFTNGVPSH